MPDGSHAHDYATVFDIEALRQNLDSLGLRVKALEDATSPDVPVFEGDPSGRTDVTTALAAFLAAGGSRALAPSATYRVSHVDVRGATLALDARGATLAGRPTKDWPTLALLGCRGSVTDIAIRGAGYRWTMPTEGRHGLGIYGGSVRIARLVTRDVEGDGIYVGYGWGIATPASGVVIEAPDIEGSARNGIAVVAGEVYLNGGRIARSGLHGLDAEPNDAVGAASLRLVASGTDIRRSNDIAEVPGLGYAVGGGWGHTGTRKPLIELRGLTGDALTMAVGHLDRLVIRDCRSDQPAVAEWWDAGATDIGGNAGLTVVAS